MQQLVPEPHSRSLRPVRRGNTLRTLSLWAALCGLGTTLGCGGAPAVSPIDNADSVQNNLTPMCLTETQGDPTSCKDEKTWSSYAAMACAGKGLMMTKISYATSCGMGLYRQTTYECCSGTTPPMPMCMWTPAIPGPTVCRSDADWKKEGTTYCSAHGLQLSDLKLDHPCTAGGYASAQYECCTPTPMPPPTPMCTAEALASMSCVDDATWKTKADAECKTKKLTLGTISPGAACMGGHLDIKFECCGPTTPPPPPPMCIADSLASMTCVDDATWKTRAAAACTAEKRTLGSLSLGTACMGGHLDVKFECCGTPPPPPPPPPPMCVGEALASTSCVDDATWKTKADAECKTKKLTLGSLAFGTACMGGHQDIKFECCGPTPPPPPPPPMCSTEKAPSTTMCQTPDQWKVQGDAFCTAKHESLSGLTLNGACTGGFSDAQFICCPATPPPPPPPTCTAGALGDGHTCATAADLKSQAEAVCKMAGATLSGFATYDTCAMTGSFLHAKYQCCK